MELEEKEEEGSSRQSGTSVLRKEPFFSRSCGENGFGVENPSSPSRRSEEEKESGDLDLPVVRSDGSEGSGLSNEFEHRSMHLNSSFAVYVNRNGEEKRCALFDVENGGGSYSPAPAAVSIPMLLKTLFFVLVWYAFSTCLTIYNKTLLGDKLGKFPAPLLMNTVHFTMQAVLSKVILRFQIRRSEHSVIMAWKDYFLRVVPTALATALDINLSNASLVFITVTFATMCKSASPIFLLLFAFAFRLERPSIRLFGIIFVISIGVFLTVEKETEFELWGFVFVMLAAVMSGFRWSMTQILLQKEAYGLKNPISLMSYVTPVMAVITLILSLVMEPWTELYKNAYFDSKWHIIRTCLILLIGGTVAFFMVLTEYILVSTTSAVTVTIAGAVKEAVTILVAVLYFHDQFTLLKGVGLVVIFIGVSLFNLYKYLKLLKGELSNTEETNSVPNGAAKYIILDEMDIEDDER